MIEDAVEYGNSVYEVAFLYEEDLFKAEKHGTRWYRSKERAGGRTPFGSFMMNKKWTFEEEFNNHMMRFQQVKCSEFYLF